MLHPSRLAHLALVLVSASFLFLMKDFILPHAFHAKTYPAHDAHEQEKVTLAADPYDLPDKEATVFRAHYIERGVLPVHFILSNDRGRIITMTNMKILLITKKKVKIEPATNEDIFRMLSASTQRIDAPTNKPIPLPRKVKSSVPKEALEEVPMAQFADVAVEPKTTQAGFLFFDVAGIENPLAGARLVVTGIRDDAGNELFYFEIPLEDYLGYKPGAAPPK